MAAFPPYTQIVGSHGGVYEAYYIQADPLGTGSIGALDAANFLKKSKLSDTILSQVWDMSDPIGKGYLEKTGFFVALKLIALAQNKQEMSVAKLTVETPPPDLGPVEAVEQPAQTADIANIPWDITLSEKSKYDKVFDSLQPVNNMLAGDKVKPVLMNSKLPVDILGRIWDMSDIDKDGYLDSDEFAVAMHLVYQAREGGDTPTVLRPGLVPPSKRKGRTTLPGAYQVLPTMGSIAGTGMSQPPWIVTAAEKSNSDAIFKQLDTDRDGLVSGAEIRDVMAQSGLSTNVLAHIWGLCDSQSVGKLTPEQFALAMHLIQQKLKGVEPPAQLTPDMIPPSLRPITDPGAFGVRDGTNAGPYSHAADFSAIKELDQISKEIEDIKKDKLQTERDKSQQEADIKLRQSEVLILQKELDSLSGTMAQLEAQKKEAQKRLDDLDDKRSSLERNVQDLREKTDSEQIEVKKMKTLLSCREQVIQDQEVELSRLKTELAQLKDEESKLEQTANSSKQQLEQLATSQGEIHYEISLTKARLKQLQGEEPEFASFLETNGDHFTSKNGVLNNVSAPAGSFEAFSALDGFKDDPFKDHDPFAGNGALSGSQTDPFQNEDPFKDSDPFKSSDPFAAEEDVFKDAFSGSSTAAKSDNGFGFSSGPFASSNQVPKDSGTFDAFGVGWESNTAFGKSNNVSGEGTDPFGSPSKPGPNTAQKKPPPPRPAPPKSKSPTPFGSRTASPKLTVQPLSGFDSDPFGGSDPFSGSGTKNMTVGSTDAFANFADFSPGKFAGPDDDAWGSSSLSTKSGFMVSSSRGGFDDSEA